jgi:hypothetical protein
LEVWPDLLSPLGELHYEPSHSRLLAYLMDPRRGSDLARDLLRSFLAELAKCPPETMEPQELRAAEVTPEAWLPDGRRIDIRIATKSLLVFVEMKVYAAEGFKQLPSYRKVLDQQKGARTARLVYLTLPGADKPSADCEHVNFERLLLTWLPIAEVDGEAPGYLARYLKSVALILESAGEGGFERWTFAEQRAALDLIEGRRST